MTATDRLVAALSAAALLALLAIGSHPADPLTPRPATLNTTATR